METRRVVTPEQAERLAAYVVGLPLPFTITIGSGKSRTIPQNSLLHKWFGEVARHFEHMTAAEVKGQCHYRWGLPIRRRNAGFAFLWDRATAGLSYEQKCKVLSGTVLNRETGKWEKSPESFRISSGMNVPELREYMDAMMKEYADQGVYLTDPNLRGYDEDMSE